MILNFSTTFGGQISERFKGRLDRLMDGRLGVFAYVMKKDQPVRVESKTGNASQQNFKKKIAGSNDLLQSNLNYHCV